jgi:hypothetical protein
MHRIDTATREEDLFGPGKDGFTGGDPLLAVPPTDLSPDWCNDVQENLVEVVEAAGLAPTKGDGGQVLKAFRTLVGVRFDSVPGRLKYIDADGVLAPKTRLAEIMGAELLPGMNTTQFEKVSGGVPVPFVLSTTAAAWFFVANVRRIVPKNATITRIEAWVTPGAARATVANRMTLYLKPTGLANMTATDNGAASTQTIELTGLSLVGDAVDVIAIRTGNDATTDIILGLGIDYTAHGPAD